MKLYTVFDFDEGPHYSFAIVRADSEDAARSVLDRYIKEHKDKDGDYSCEGVWNPHPAEDWDVREVPATDDVVAILGAGCR